MELTVTHVEITADINIAVVAQTTNTNYPNETYRFSVVFDSALTAGQIRDSLITSVQKYWLVRDNTNAPIDAS